MRWPYKNNQQYTANKSKITNIKKLNFCRHETSVLKAIYIVFIKSKVICSKVHRDAVQISAINSERSCQLHFKTIFVFKIIFCLGWSGKPHSFKEKGLQNFCITRPGPSPPFRDDYQCAEATYWIFDQREADDDHHSTKSQCANDAIQKLCTRWLYLWPCWQNDATSLGSLILVRKRIMARLQKFQNSKPGYHQSIAWWYRWPKTWVKRLDEMIWSAYLSGGLVIKWAQGAETAPMSCQGKADEVDRCLRLR